MSDITMLVRITLRLPSTRDFDEAEDKARDILEEALSKKLAIRSAQIVRTETIVG